MIDFLIKSAFSLAILLAFYKLVLEYEKVHQFNRFYLLGSIVFSLVMPFLKVEIVSKVQSESLKIENLQLIASETSNKSDNMYQMFVVIYLLVVAFLTRKFVINIQKFIQKIKSNPIRNYNKAKLVLLDQEIIPYTFLNYIFISRHDYLENLIENELMAHELVHVKEKHTIDILLIEILKIVFWFNPIFIFYKKAIQLNHEFLADQKVIETSNNIPFYQSLLLTKACQKNYTLASNLNYLLTKKRLMMMTKKSKKTNQTIKKLFIVPVVTVIIFLFCVSSVAQQKAKIVKTVSKIVTATKPVDKTKKVVKLKQIKDNIDLKSSNKLENKTETAEIINEQSSFPGGNAAFYKLIGDKFIVPTEVSGVQKIYIQFSIEADGSLSDFECKKDIGFGCCEQVIKILKEAPKWNPGKSGDKMVKCTYQLPITIAAQE